MNSRIQDTPEFAQGRQAARKGTCMPREYYDTFRAHRWREGHTVGTIEVEAETRAAEERHRKLIERHGA